MTMNMDETCSAIATKRILHHVLVYTAKSQRRCLLRYYGSVSRTLVNILLIFTKLFSLGEHFTAMRKTSQIL